MATKAALGVAACTLLILGGGCGTESDAGTTSQEPTSSVSTGAEEALACVDLFNAQGVPRHLAALSALSPDGRRAHVGVSGDGHCLVVLFSAGRAEILGAGYYASPDEFVTVTKLLLGQDFVPAGALPEALQKTNASVDVATGKLHVSN